MAYDAIRWGYQDGSGRQREADGSRLINLFPIETPDPAADKVPADLWNAPGAQTWKASPLTGMIELERNIPLGFDLVAENDKPRGQWANGVALWVANAGAVRSLFAYALATRTPMPGLNIPLGGDTSSPKPTGVTGRGTKIWVAFENFAGVHAYDTTTQMPDATLNIQTTQEDIVALWVEGDVLWVLGKNSNARPYRIPPSTADLPASFSLLSGGIINRTPAGATLLADGSLAIIDEATRDIFGNQVNPGGTDRNNDFDFRKAYPDISSAIGFVNDSTTAWRVAANANQIYAMHAGRKVAFEDRNIELPEGVTASYLFLEGAMMWVLLTPTDGSAPYIAQFSSQTGRMATTRLYPGPDVADPRGIFSRGEFAWIADRAVRKILRFRFGTVGAAVPANNITVPPERDSPRGIWADANNALILDMLDAQAYGYNREDGTPNATINFPLSDTPNAIGLSATSQYLFLLTSTTIDTYQRSGKNKLPLLTINLDPLNADPKGIYTTENNAYVLDGSARRIFAYLWTAGGRFGQPNTALNKTPQQLYAGLREPVGITGIRTGGATRVWMLGEGTGIRELEQNAEGVLTARGAGAANLASATLGDNDANDLAVYDNNGTLRILWADDDDNAIYASDMTGGGAWGAPTRLISQSSNPHAVAVDDTHIYTTDDGRIIVRYARADLAKDATWSIRLSDHNISRRGRGLFIYQGRIWMVAHNTQTVYCFDIGTKMPVNDLRIFSSVTRPRSLWGDGRFMYITDDRDSATQGGVRGYWMGSSVRDPERDIYLHADNDQPYGLAGTATTMYVGNRGTRQRAFAYRILSRSYLESGGFPLLSANSRPVAMWADANGAYVLDENRTAYWYGFRVAGLIRDTPGDIPLHADNANVSGIWGDADGHIFAANGSPGGIFAYDEESKANLPALQFDLPQELIDNIPTGLWGNAQILWIGAELNGKVYGFLRNAGAARGVLCPLTPRNASPYGIWSSAEFHYVNDTGTRRIYVYNVDDCQLALSDQTESFQSDATWVAMIAIESPVNGNHLFGVAQDVYFHFNPGPPFNDASVTHTGQFTEYAEEQLNGPVKLATDNRYIFITTPVSIKIYDVLTRQLVVETLTITPTEEAEDTGEEGTEVVLPQPTNLSAVLRDEDWVAAAWSDGYFLVGTRSGEVFHSNHQSLKFDQLDFSRTEAYPDTLISIEVYNRQLVLFGSESIEQWYNSGDATAVFQRNLSLTVNVGAAAQAAISVDLEGIFFLATNGIVYHFIGRMTRVSTLAVEESIKKSDKSKAISYTYTEEGQRFYVLTLDIAGVKKTWAMHIETRLWHERTITDVRAFVTFQGQHIASRTGGLDELSTDLGSDHGEIIHREAVMPALQGGHMRQYVHAIEIDVPYRDGGSAQDKVALDWSYNGGKTFVPSPGIEQLLPAAAPADDEEVPRLRWNRLGGGDRVRNFRLSIDALRRVNILGAYIEHEGGDT